MLVLEGTMTDQTLLTRQELAERWQCSSRTLDRLRDQGRLPWLNIASGNRRPLIRFRLADIEEFEARIRRPDAA
jgi:hypothetical protein